MRPRTAHQDFLRLAAAGAEHPGIVFYPSQQRTVGEVIRAVLLIWEVLEPAEMHNRVEYV